MPFSAKNIITTKKSIYSDNLAPKQWYNYISTILFTAYFHEPTRY